MCGTAFAALDGIKKQFSLSALLVEVVTSWLTLIGAIGVSVTFWLFALFCLAGWIWVHREVPETKGRSLEQIEASWAAPA